MAVGATGVEEEAREQREREQWLRKVGLKWNEKALTLRFEEEGGAMSHGRWAATSC